VPTAAGHAGDGSPAAPPPAIAARIPDDEVARAVRTELTEDRELQVKDLAVEAQQGVVTVSGTVDMLGAKRLAIGLAETVKGVRAVVDSVKVLTSSHDDSRIRADALSALQHGAGTRAGPIALVVRNGIATLQGTVSSSSQRWLVEDILGRVPDIVSIKDDLRVAAVSRRTDEEMAGEARERLTDDAWLEGTDIRIAVHDGAAYIEGVVGSVAERRRAARDAEDVEGVSSVDSSAVRVEWWTQDMLRRKGPVFVDDAKIEIAVRAAFHDDPRVGDQAPQILSRGGILTLSGEVNSLSSREAADEDARNTRGVRRVDDRVVVVPVGSPSDGVIMENVATALKGDPLLPDKSEIQASVTNGKVTLTGAVGSDFQRFRAEDDAGNVPAVREVDERIDVRKEYGRRLERRVLDALFWDPRVGEGPQVRLYNGDTVILSGSLDSPGQVVAAVQDARRVGARHVLDELGVRGSTGASGSH
jgi:osmotically-inducible protein OsmY